MKFMISDVCKRINTVALIVNAQKTKVWFNCPGRKLRFAIGNEELITRGRHLPRAGSDRRFNTLH